MSSLTQTIETPAVIKNPLTERIFYLGAPSMGALLWVKVPPRAARGQRSEAHVGKADRRGEERGEEPWEPMDKNRIKGGADQGERARNREALVVKDQAA